MSTKPSETEQKSVKFLFFLFGMGGLAAIAFLIIDGIKDLLGGNTSGLLLNIFFMFPTFALTYFAFVMSTKPIETGNDDA